MNRRQFLRRVAALAPLLSVPALWTKAPPREIAFTFDDPTIAPHANFSWQDVNERILGTLGKRQLKSILFVCGKRVDSDDGKRIISAWDHAGHEIGNHSYSHLNFNETPANGSDSGSTLAEFEADALKNESLIRSFRHFVRLFRYPFFKEGETAEKRDGMRSFLQQHGYRIGRATIDASDWAISSRLEKRSDRDRTADLTPYRDFFLQHIWERAQYYDSLARRVLGHSVRHTVLLHHNLLNALFLDDLIALFMARGWKPVDASRAYADPVYDRQPKILPAGESLIWALAKESGKFEGELRYPGEDDVYENPKMDALKL